MTAQPMTERPSPGEERGTRRPAPPAGCSATGAFPVRQESEVFVSGPFSPEGQPAPCGDAWTALRVLLTDNLGLRRRAESRERITEPQP